MAHVGEAPKSSNLALSFQASSAGTRHFARKLSLSLSCKQDLHTSSLQSEITSLSNLYIIPI